MIQINEFQIILRSAVNSDTLFLKNLSEKAFNLFGDYGEVVLEWFESGNSRAVIDAYKDRPAGFAMLREPFDRYDLIDSSELLAIAVVSEYRGIGIGTNLVKRIEELACEMGTKILFLHTATENKYAIKLFSSSGFRTWQIKKGFYPKGQDAFVMAKEIP